MTAIRRHCDAISGDAFGVRAAHVTALLVCSAFAWRALRYCVVAEPARQRTCRGHYTCHPRIGTGIPHLLPRTYTHHISPTITPLPAHTILPHCPIAFPGAHLPCALHLCMPWMRLRTYCFQILWRDVSLARTPHRRLPTRPPPRHAPPTPFRPPPPPPPRDVAAAGRATLGDTTLNGSCSATGKWVWLCRGCTLYLTPPHCRPPCLLAFSAHSALGYSDYRPFPPTIT